MAKANEVATQDANAVAVPDFLKGMMNDNRGSEDVGADDIIVPRLELVQSLSKCRKKNDPAYIAGAEEGMLYNSVTRELYGESVNVVPVTFKKEFLLWRDQDLGGGFGVRTPGGDPPVCKKQLALHRSQASAGRFFPPVFKRVA